VHNEPRLARTFAFATVTSATLAPLATFAAAPFTAAFATVLTTTTPCLASATATLALCTTAALVFATSTILARAWCSGRRGIDASAE